jgi:diphthamide biosynthesis enzyme Dph1/Dph2-like protein
MDFNLELDRAVKEIDSSKAKSVCIQLPDGLKPRAREIADFLQSKTKARVTIWAGSCFGACDTARVDEKDFDLLIQWGHSKWKSK